MSKNLKNGEFYARGIMVFRAPIRTKTETGTNISLGFPVCTVSEYVSADNLVEFLNASRHHNALVNALEGVIRDINDYERANNLAPNPDRTECWDSVARAKSALASIKETA